MSETEQSPLNDAVRDAQRFVQWGVHNLINWQRSQNTDPIDFIQFNLAPSLPALPLPSNPILDRIRGKPPLSLTEIERAFERIAMDKRPQGVILYMQGADMPLADLQTLRASIARLRQKGKRVVVYAKYYDLRMYYVASAADTILLQPGSLLMTTGLLTQQVYLKEGLNEIGVEADVVAISPFKSAGDQFSRTEPSDEVKAQTNWLLDSFYDQMIEGIAQGRGISADDARAMIDSAPHNDREALEAGFIDGITNEEGFGSTLHAEHIVLWDKADGLLLEKWADLSGKYVAVLQLEGSIVDGESMNPPIDIPIPLFGGERIGDLTVVQQVRQLMNDDRAAAVVLYINSPGGSATSSEAIASALDELAKTRPVVVCMNGVAASGGYYISTPADHIVAQPGTITGSIGVINLKLITNETLKKLKLNPYYYMRGENAGILAPIEPFSESQREKVRDSITRIYNVFLDRVAAARKMKADDVDAVGGGRVWTGQQAYEHGLVDTLGGLYEAINKARELARLGEDIPAILVRKPIRKPLPAQLAEQADPAAALRYWVEGVEMLGGARNLMLMPYDITLRG